MRQVSVVMSVYKETIQEVKTALRSIQNQTYPEFEFIIVLDNPEYESMWRFLKDQAALDDRIRLIRNHKNIGLAMSLNKAADAAQFPYIVRMDADDISSHDRIETELSYMMEHGCDLVFSDYLLTDQNGTVTGIFNEHYDDIEKSLIISNIIHHPTVLFTKDIFYKAGRYRNFPCSQDYDLWLRMMECRAHFGQIGKVLLKYRLRDASVSNAHALKQTATLCYIKKLYFERMRHGTDSYSLAHYHRYMKQFGPEIYDKAKSLRFKSDLFYAQKMISRGHIFLGNLCKVFILIQSKCYRTYYIQKMKSQLYVFIVRKSGRK